jgi:hypothetical protein
MHDIIRKISGAVFEVEGDGTEKVTLKALLE